MLSKKGQSVASLPNVSVLNHKQAIMDSILGFILCNSCSWISCSG